VLPEKSFNLSVIGTPAEETTGGKIPMIKEGVFEQIDVAMMFHAHSVTTANRPCIGRTALEFEFFGKTAHASSFPYLGINALDGLILTYNNINALRQQVREDVRIHGIIIDGGKVRNSIPDYAKGEFFVRARDKAYMEDIVEKVKACAHGAARATGAKLKIGSSMPTYLPDIPIPSLISAFEDNLSSLGLQVDKLEPPFKLGSSDFGNLSQQIPSIMGFINITSSPTHTQAFTNAVGSKRGQESMIQAVKAMAMTTVDLYKDPNLLNRIKQEFENTNSRLKIV
ncbi:M20/M25/M40 family metallo-hydrolase, partial [Radiobacillus sp. PE A8.2]|uniref:M20/M25/M40 family metallo-hydrolase n=1 Tax=Radiobacillus sp. PE A8.2 TaxID=3380349 RepID=UPI00388E946E